MNAYEKPLYYTSLLLLIGTMVLRLLHLVRPETAISLLVLGTMFLGIAYQRYTRRLNTRIAELEAQLPPS
ncbi:hypothetical protein D3Y59_02770 [Hymenobacter oligotrophus]|uniref:Uncharacterized protein n=1 Tax=Hymenobacter oligotrophus TaxID=2319843 RepID=A0A3B7QW89_9BACT|nr:hypothetical protein [Hymenobacter oligotrophus]AYA36074.1 hypothetical protein D3Y59_02770 [Hymenobacter oligotrophus]